MSFQSKPLHPASAPRQRTNVPHAEAHPQAQASESGPRLGSLCAVQQGDEEIQARCGPGRRHFSTEHGCVNAQHPARSEGFQYWLLSHY